jgi:hypothetical protein
MLQVTHEGGWFMVKDLEGTETRYRKKELVSLTQSLLEQPNYEPASLLQAATAPNAPEPPRALLPSPSAAQRADVALSDAVAETVAETAISTAPTVDPRPDEPKPEISVTPTAIELVGTSEVIAIGEQQAIKPSEKEPASIPAAAPSAYAALPANGTKTQEPDRRREDKAYFRTLGLIFIIVAAVLCLVVVYLVFIRG